MINMGFVGKLAEKQLHVLYLEEVNCSHPHSIHTASYTYNTWHNNKLMYGINHPKQRMTPLFSWETKMKYISGFTPNYCTWHNGWCRIPSAILRNHHKILYSNQPGSIGHSFKDANSAGLLPVNTQLELRSIIGILKIDKKKHILAKIISYGTYTRK